MTTPISELIAVEVLAAVNAITAANGFNQDLSAIRQKRNDFSDVSPDDLAALIYQGDDRPIGDQANCVATWEMDISVIVFVLNSDSSATAIDTRINQVVADCRKKFIADTTRGGNAIDTVMGPANKFDNGKGFSGVEVQFTVVYRTVYTDPYTGS